MGVAMQALGGGGGPPVRLRGAAGVAPAIRRRGVHALLHQLCPARERRRAVRVAAGGCRDGLSPPAGPPRNRLRVDQQSAVFADVAVRAVSDLHSHGCGGGSVLCRICTVGCLCVNTMNSLILISVWTDCC